MAKSAQQRETVRRLSPPWLAGGFGERFLYAIGLASDVLLEKMDEAMKAHLPTYADPSALPAIGADRVMAQGVSELATSFAQRLKRAFDAWQRAGSSLAVLDQTVPYLGQPTQSTSMLPTGVIVGTNGTTTTWQTLYANASTGAPPTLYSAQSVNWNWDGTYPWWRKWLVLFFYQVAGASGSAASIGLGSDNFFTVTGLSGLTPGATPNGLYLTLSNTSSAANNGAFQVTQILSTSSCIVAIPSGVQSDANNGSIVWSLGQYPSTAPAPVWGSPQASWNTATMSWGLNVTSTQVTALRNILALWKDAEAYYQNIVFAFPDLIPSYLDVDLYSPYGTQDNVNPGGTWATWATTSGGVSQASRIAASGYVLIQNTFDCFADGTGQYGLNSSVVTTT